MHTYSIELKSVNPASVSYNTLKLVDKASMEMSNGMTYGRLKRDEYYSQNVYLMASPAVFDWSDIDIISPRFAESNPKEVVLV